MAWCDVICSWNLQSDSDQSLDSVVVYTVEGGSEHQSGEPSPSGVRLKLPDVGPSGTTTPCTLTLSGNPHHVDRVLISSVDVLCNARRGEVFSSIGEYITTTEGLRVDEELDIDSPLFMLQHSLKSPANRCSIKLVSLSDPHSVWIHSLYITIKITPRTHEVGITSNIDLDKVKGRLNDTGQELPGNARNLLSAMETFQKTKQSALSSMMGFPSPGPSLGNPEQMAALMAMFPAMQVAPPVQNNMQEIKHSGDKNEHRTLEEIELCSKSHNQVDSKEVRQDCQNVDILSDISNGKKTIVKDTRCVHSSHGAACAIQTEGRGDTVTETPNNECLPNIYSANTLTYLLNIEQRFHKAIHEAEKNIMENMEEKMSIIEERIQTKLDLILSQLSSQGVTRQQDYIPNSARQREMPDTCVDSSLLSRSVTECAIPSTNDIDADSSCLGGVVSLNKNT